MLFRDDGTYRTWDRATGDAVEVYSAGFGWVFSSQIDDLKCVTGHANGNIGMCLCVVDKVSMFCGRMYQTVYIALIRFCVENVGVHDTLVILSFSLHL